MAEIGRNGKCSLSVKKMDGRGEPKKNTQMIREDCNCVGFECRNCQGNKTCYMFDDGMGEVIDWDETRKKLGDEAEILFSKFHSDVRSDSNDRDVLARLGHVVMTRDNSLDVHGKLILKSLDENGVVEMLEKKCDDEGNQRKCSLTKDETGLISRVLCAMLTKDKKVRQNVAQFPLYRHFVLPAVDRIKQLFEARRRKRLEMEMPIYHFDMTVDDLIKEAQFHQIRAVKTCQDTQRGM